MIKSNGQHILLRVKDIYVAFTRNKWTNNPTLSMDKFGTSQIYILYVHAFKGMNSAESLCWHYDKLR